MANSKTPAEERSIILQHPHKRPYETETTVTVRTAASLGDTEGVSLLLDDGSIVTIEPVAKAPWEGLLAKLLVDKYDEPTPLYRQAKE